MQNPTWGIFGEKKMIPPMWLIAALIITDPPAPANTRTHSPGLSRLPMARSMEAIRTISNQRRTPRRAMSIAEFCERYGPGRTKVYEELKSGRLRGRKIGSRTIITEDDAEDWLRSLPVIGAARWSSIRVRGRERWAVPCRAATL
jgi:excisionase family DNA binding protein